jgi:hypothetical protein
MAPIVHNGTTFSAPYRVTLPKMDLGTSEVNVALSDAMVMDVGYMLHRDGELAQVTSISSSHVTLSRGCAGSPASNHESGQWEIVSTPMLAEPEDRDWVRELVVTCKTCGAPSQRVGQPCHYCSFLVSE